MSIADQYEAFFIKATADKYPFSQEKCLRLGFYAGFFAAFRGATAGKTEVEIEAEFAANAAELTAAFSDASVRGYYENPHKKGSK